MKYCEHCGQENSLSSNFCQACGKKMSTNNNSKQKKKGNYKYEFLPKLWK